MLPQDKYNCFIVAQQIDNNKNLIKSLQQLAKEKRIGKIEVLIG